MTRRLHIGLLLTLAVTAPASAKDRHTARAQASGHYNGHVEDAATRRFSISGTGFRGEAVVEGVGEVVVKLYEPDGSLRLSAKGVMPGHGESLTFRYGVLTSAPSFIGRLSGQKGHQPLLEELVLLTQREDGTLAGVFEDGISVWTPHEPVPSVVRAAVRPLADERLRLSLQVRKDSEPLPFEIEGPYTAYRPEEDGSWRFRLWTEAKVKGPAPGVDAIHGSLVNLRAGPGTEHPIVDRAVRGQAFTRVERRADGWTKLAYTNGQEVYALTRLLTPASGLVLLETATLTLQSDGAGWVGTITDRTGEHLLRIELTRRLRALVTYSGYSSDAGAFRVYAREVRAYYASKGFIRTDILPASDTSEISAKLLEAAGKNLPYDRLVFISHGGWDGPMIGPQPSVGSSGFKELASAIKQGTSSGAMIYASACHAGGDNYAERKGAPDHRVWTRSLTQHTDRIAVGPAGSTSTEYTLQMVKFMEGEANTRQEIVWSSPEAWARVGYDRTLEGARMRPWSEVPEPSADDSEDDWAFEEGW